MDRQKIKEFIENRLEVDGRVSIGLAGIHLLRVTEPLGRAPAIYEPTVVAIVNGAKEAILDGRRYIFDRERYVCSTISMPVEAGAISASPENPLLSVFIALDTKAMTELVLEMEMIPGTAQIPKNAPSPQGFSLARWDDSFADALWRLLQLADNPADIEALGKCRLRELYYAILKGDAGYSVRRAFGVDNKISKIIEYLATHLHEPINIETMADQAGMSRTVFHRKFKRATMMSPIQFVKSMRLSAAAMKIAEGMSVNEAAIAVGYFSLSQFSREFRRSFGEPPKQWSHAHRGPRWADGRD